MALVDWEPGLSVGVFSLDQQHKQLIAIVNELHEAMREGKGRTVVAGVCERLVEYTRRHFADEERLMQQHGYAGLARHRDQHAQLTAQVMGCRKRLEGEKAVNAIQMMNLLQTWLVEHIMQADKGYAAPLAAAGAR